MSTVIKHQDVARLLAWCQSRTDDPQIREIATVLRNLWDERMDVLAALHLPDHGPVDPVEEIRRILRNWDEAEDRAAAAEQEHAPGEKREGEALLDSSAISSKARRPLPDPRPASPEGRKQREADQHLQEEGDQS